MKGIKLIAGNANPQLAKGISDYLGTPLCTAEVERFPDGEIKVEIKEIIRGADIFVIQPTCPPVNDHLMELLIIIDALKRASARRITAVMPYFGYGRQDKKEVGRVPISAKLVANLITTAGANRVLTMDLHAEQIQGFFDISVDNLRAAPLLADYFKHRGLTEDAVIISPDVGGARRARAIATRLKLPLAIIEKRHEGSKIEALTVIGDVRGKRALITDDLLATGTTIIKGAEALIAAGAREVIAACVHGLFVGDALRRLESSPISKVIVTDTIPTPKSEKIEVVSVGELFAKAIERIHNDRSISELFR